MRSAALITCLSVGAAAASTPPPPPPPNFTDVLNAAKAELEACTQLGVKAGVYGDVELKLEKNGAWVGSASKMRLPAALLPTGTGKSISGKLTVTGGGDPTRQEIIVTCGPDEKLRRRARPAADGTFVVEDVGAPPCTVRGSGMQSQRGVTVTKVPATGVLVDG